MRQLDTMPIHLLTFSRGTRLLIARLVPPTTSTTMRLSTNPFASQVMMQGTCQGFVAITGGTGEYKCASGTAELVYDDGEYLTFMLNVCDVCAEIDRRDSGSYYGRW